MAVNPNLDPHAITDDPIVNEVIELIVRRHLQGMEKFGKGWVGSGTDKVGAKSNG